MLKVVIADDEARIISLIRMLADWEALGMEVVGTAGNGMEAMDLIKSLRPDILITDLRMPGYHGLELISKAKEFDENLEIVIISGHAHFEYAQTAIRYGVGDYLLKPIQKEELTKTLEKLGLRCLRRLDTDSEVEQLRRSSQEDLARAHGRLLMDISLSRIESITKAQLSNEYHYFLQSGVMQIFALKMDYDLDYYSGASITVIRHKTEQIIRAELSPICYSLILVFREGWGHGLINYEPAHRDEVRKQMRIIVNQLTARRELFGDIIFSLALSRPTKDAEDLITISNETQMIAYERFIEGTGRLLERLPAQHNIKNTVISESYRRAIAMTIENPENASCAAAIELLRSQISKDRYMSGYEVYALILSACNYFLTHSKIENQSEHYVNFERLCNRCSSTQQLLETLQKFQSDLLEKESQNRHNDLIRPVRIAKEYIQKEYSNNITLEDICAKTGFSVPYFSALFKKETGEGFAKYLTRIRMERAKELLQQTDLSINEICQQVGYSDLKHFTQTFKKTTNLNPGQYRKLYG